MKLFIATLCVLSACTRVLSITLPTSTSTSTSTSTTTSYEEGCGVVQVLGASDCVVNCVYRERKIANEIETELYDRMTYADCLVHCFLGEWLPSNFRLGPSGPGPEHRERAKRASEDNSYVKNRLELTLCYVDCHLTYWVKGGNHSNHEHHCESIDYVHLTLCYIGCVKEKPYIENKSPGIFNEVTEKELGGMKLDLTLAYVDCILASLNNADETCSSTAYLDVVQCHFEHMVDGRQSLSGFSRKKRAVSSKKLYDRLLNTECVMLCLKESHDEDECWMDNFFFHLQCLAECTMTSDPFQRLIRWHQRNAAGRNVEM